MGRKVIRQRVSPERTFRSVLMFYECVCVCNLFNSFKFYTYFYKIFFIFFIKNLISTVVTIIFSPNNNYSCFLFLFLKSILLEVCQFSPSSQNINFVLSLSTISLPSISFIFVFIVAFSFHLFSSIKSVTFSYIWSWMPFPFSLSSLLIHAFHLYSL